MLSGSGRWPGCPSNMSIQLQPPVESASHAQDPYTRADPTPKNTAIAVRPHLNSPTAPPQGEGIEPTPPSLERGSAPQPNPRGVHVEDSGVLLRSGGVLPSLDALIDGEALGELLDRPDSTVER